MPRDSRAKATQLFLRKGNGIISFPALLRVKRVVANSPVRVTEQSLIAREYAEGLPCKSNEVDFVQGKRHYLVSRSVARETSRIETRQFACRLHIAIDIRRGSRKIAETILRTETALSRFIYYVVASSRDRAIFDCEGICRGTPVQKQRS